MDTKGKRMIDRGDGVLVDEHGQLFTPEREPIWMTEDGRLIPLTKIDNDHLAAIRSWLHAHAEGRGASIAHVEGEVGRRERHQLEQIADQGADTGSPDRR
jgi:hypothetical protein